MMKIGLIGSTPFYNTYKKAFSSYPQIELFNECDMDAALMRTGSFEYILNHCHYLFFEKIDSDSAHLASAGLKNGKHILIDHAKVSMEEIQEIYDISNEGNLKCIIFPASSFYAMFEPVRHRISNPFQIEISAAYPITEQYRLNEDIRQTISYCVQNLHYLFKSDIKQINVKQSKVFSDKTDFLSVQLDFSNGCNVYIRLNAFAEKTSHTMKVYQHALIIKFDLEENCVVSYEKTDNEIHEEHVRIPSSDMEEKKVQHFLTLAHDDKPAAHSILDNYLVSELSAKILKKINSLYD